MRPTLEICVETLAAAQTAARGGADRIELCSSLSDGGVTPSLGLLEQALATVQAPIHCMIRPRGGDFCYSAGELRAMERDIRLAKQAGAAGVVLGVLTSEADVDIAATLGLVEVAQPMKVTFHRAFDVTRNLTRALEDVLATGADILLTSGGAQRLCEAVDVVAGLVEQASGRVEIMGGSGVTVKNAAALFEATGVAGIHASLRRARPAAEGTETADREAIIAGTPALSPYGLREEDVRAVAAALDRAAAEMHAPVAARIR